MPGTVWALPFNSDKYHARKKELREMSLSKIKVSFLWTILSPSLQSYDHGQRCHLIHLFFNMISAILKRNIIQAENVLPHFVKFNRAP